MKRFALEIYEPDNAYDVLEVFESDEAFCGISAGDYINLKKHLLEVVRVEHILWDSQGTPKQKLSIFTTVRENTPEARLEPMD